MKSVTCPKIHTHMCQKFLSATCVSQTFLPLNTCMPSYPSDLLDAHAVHPVLSDIHRTWWFFLKQDWNHSFSQWLPQQIYLTNYERTKLLWNRLSALLLALWFSPEVAHGYHCGTFEDPCPMPRPHTRSSGVTAQALGHSSDVNVA